MPRRALGVGERSSERQPRGAAVSPPSLSPHEGATRRRRRSIPREPISARQPLQCGDENVEGGRVGDGDSDLRGEGDADDDLRITDDAMSTLYGRISDLRARDVKLDRVCAYNWREGTCTHDLLFEATDKVQHLAWEGDQIAFGTSGGGNWIISRSSGNVVNVFEGHDGDVTSLFFDGEFLISGGSDRTVRVHKNVRNKPVPDVGGEHDSILRGHEGVVTGVTRLDPTRLASCSLDGTMLVWDAGTGEVLHRVSEPSPMCCLGAADGYMVTGLADGTVVAWEAKNVEAAPRQILKMEAHSGAVSTLSFPSKEVLVTGGADGRVKYWDLVQGGAPVGNRYEVDGRNMTHMFKGHSGAVSSVLSNEYRVVSAGEDGKVCVWDIATGRELFQICGYVTEVRSVLFDRECLLTDGTDNQLFIHDFTARRGIPSMIGEEANGDEVEEGDEGDEGDEGRVQRDLRPGMGWGWIGGGRLEFFGMENDPDPDADEDAAGAQD